MIYMANREDFQLLRRLASQWDHVVAKLRVLNPHVAVEPDSGYDVFKNSGEQPIVGSTRIDINPVALRVPERGGDPVHNIFIALSGFLYFDTEESQADRLVVTKFGTRVAYFRKVGTRFDHVFGAHFDFSKNDVGHPAFHGQFTSLVDMFVVISSQLHVRGEVANCLPNVLSTVRVPTAQLDVFSLLLLVFADHLLSSLSTTEEKAAFNDLLRLASSVRGAGHLITRLATEHVETCMSARHWYPTIA